MVSPFKIAREAALDKTAGGTKFLGEKLFEKLLRRFLQQAAVSAASSDLCALHAFRSADVSRLALASTALASLCLDLPCGCADELLIWREIGFNLCLHRHHQLHSLAGLPQ